MDNKIEIFKNEQFGEVRTILEGEKVLFCAADVAKALGYTNPNKAVNDHCRAITKRSTPISGKVQSINFIPEGDVYRLIIRSKLPAAEKFELWIHTLRDVDSAQALLNHELDFALIDSNTVFNSQLEVRPIFRERFLLLSSPDSRYPAETDPAALDPANEILVTWDPDFMHWHDSSFGPGARPLLYADTLQAADFFPRTEDLWVAAPAIAAASLGPEQARVCRFTQAPPDRINYLVTRRGEELPEPALIFLDALREHLLGRDNVQVYL